MYMNDKSSKKVLIEGTPIFRSRRGVGQYVYHVLDELFKIDHTNKYSIYGYLFVGKKVVKPFKHLPKNVTYRLIRYVPSKVINVVSRKITPPPVDLLTFTKPDIILFTNFVRSKPVSGAKTVTIIYDMSFADFGQFSNKKNNELLIKQVPKTVAKSEKIITISENAKKEIIQHYKVDAKKIEIISPAVDTETFKPQSKPDVAKIKKKYKITKDYILYTGTLEPRKNIVGILDGYANLSDELKSKYALVLAGGKGWNDEGIEKRLNQLKDLNIIRTGYVDDADLPALFTGASLFVYPSFYEGFGMPPLEAMCCGVPVITANNSSLPEVVGNAAILIDAKDTNALTYSIEKVLLDKKLQQTMIQKGFKRAKVYSWKKSAQKLHKIIEEMN